MKGIILILILIVSNVVSAEPYKEYSLEQLEALFTLHEDGDNHSIDVNTPELITMTEELEKHAISYPVKFDNDADKKRANRDAMYLTGVLDILFSSFEKDMALLDLTLRLNNISYNLDLQPQLSHERLVKAAEAIFEIDPENIETHYRLGYFLAASNNINEATPHLQKAADNGVINANYTLAMIYLSQEQADKALEYLTIYKENSPDNKEVNDLIDVIKSGEFKIEKQG